MYKVSKRPMYADSDDENKTDDPQKTQYKMNRRARNSIAMLESMIDDEEKVDNQQQAKYKINRRPKDDITDEIKDIQIESMNGKLSETNDNPMDINIFLWFEWDPKWEYQVGSHGQASYSYASSNDIIIAYNYTEMDKEWFLWLLEINHLSPTQFIWNQMPTSHETFLYPKDILNDNVLLRQISMTIKRILHQHKGSRINIKPYHGIYPEIHGAIDKIKSYVGSPENKNIQTCIAEIKWTEKWANKSCLHRYISKPNELSLFEKRNVFSHGLSECKGYVCRNIDEILIAYDQLTKEIGHNHVVLKESYGDGGIEVFFYSSKDEIIKKFVWDDYFKVVCVVENLAYHGTSKVEKVEWVGVQYYDGEVIGCGVQMFHENKIFDGSRCYTNKQIEKRLKRITTNVMKKIGAIHVGGFDFAVQHYKNKYIAPNIYLIDMNTARYTEVTQTGIIQKKFGFANENKFWIMKNLSVKQNASFATMINHHSELLFNMKSKNGVYFHSFHPKNQCVVISIFGNDEKHTFNLLNKIMNIGIFMPMEH